MLSKGGPQRDTKMILDQKLKKKEKGVPDSGKEKVTVREGGREAK